MYEDVLKKAGLDEKQAKTYVACLELGPSKVPDIARKADIKRTTAYGILDELVSMGLVSIAKKGRTEFFRAQNPESIVAMLDANRKEVAAVMPDLAELYATHHIRPRVEFFEGSAGIKRIYDNTLTCKSKRIQQIVRVRDFKAFPGGDYSLEYLKRRVAKSITAYALHPNSDDDRDETYGTESDRWKRYVRYLPPDIFHASMIMIYDYKVAMVSTKEENFGFIIESKQFSNTLRAYFDFLWKIGSARPMDDAVAQ